MTPLVITRASLWTPKGIQKDQEIVISGGRVSAAGRSGKIRRPAGAGIVDAKGDTLLPGLIDAHAHFFEFGGPQPKEVAGNPREQAFPVTTRQMLYSGVTAARAHLFDLAHGPALKRDATSDCFPAPKLQIGGPGITAGAPNMSDRQFTGYRSLDDARAKLRAAKEAGSDWIALHGLNRFPADDFRAIAAEAHRLGLKVMAGGDLAEFLEVAVEAGVDSIEYMDRTTAKTYPPRIVAGIAGKRIFVVPPVGYFYRFMAYRENPALRENPLLTMFMPPSVAAYVMEQERFTKNMAGAQEHIAQAFPNLPEKFEQLRKAGIRMPVGTDCGSPANFHIDAIWWELETRRQLGVPVNEVLTAATVHGAALLNAPDAGHLRPGARGDLLLYRGDVTEGKLEVSRVRAVAKGGRLYVVDSQWVDDYRVTN